MNIAHNLGRLCLNFIKALVLSGWDTARVIMRDPDTVDSGLTRISYGRLDPASASLLGALLSLTPGTATVAIDLQRRELLLHLLDLSQREATLAAIQRDFISPLEELRGGRT
jgi:multisubunit Na+/H+ antiporter MnhE subunit